MTPIKCFMYIIFIEIVPFIVKEKIQVAHIKKKSFNYFRSSY